MVRIDILLMANASATAFAATQDVLDAANALSPRPLFDVRVLSPDAPRVTLRGRLQAEARALACARARDVVIVPGMGEAHPEQVAARIAQDDVRQAGAWLRKAWRGGALVAASCSSVFILGQAGLLEGRRCTTTWWLAPVLQGLVPGCDVTVDSMVTEHDRVWAAGAAFAHIDLMLALVSRLAGPAVAAEVSRHLLVEQRPSQASYIAPSFLAAQDPLAGRIENLVRASLPAAPSLDEMAARLGLSPRTLSRRITQALGMPPMRFIQKIRMESAVHLLQTTRLSVEAVAHEVGFEDASALYRLMRRHTGQAPSAFKARGQGA